MFWEYYFFNTFSPYPLQALFSSQCQYGTKTVLSLWPIRPGRGHFYTPVCCHHSFSCLSISSNQDTILYTLYHWGCMWVNPSDLTLPVYWIVPLSRPESSTNRVGLHLFQSKFLDSQPEQLTLVKHRIGHSPFLLFSQWVYFLHLPCSPPRSIWSLRALYYSSMERRIQSLRKSISQRFLSEEMCSHSYSKPLVLKPSILCDSYIANCTIIRRIYSCKAKRK